MISVIIGAYNQLETLPALINALEGQTFRDFEVLLCDDGSTDGTEEWAKNLQTSFPFTYLRQENKGMRLSKNVNQGIKRAKGDYCLFIMGDSFPETNYLENLNEFADGDRVVCGVRVNIEKDRIVELDYRLRKGIVPSNPVLLISEPWKSTTGNGLAVPTSALGEGWDEKIEGYGGDDTELVSRLYHQGYPIWSVPQLVLYHNYHFAKESQKYSNQNYVARKLKEYAS